MSFLDQKEVFDVPQGFQPYDTNWKGERPKVWNDEDYEYIEEDIKNEPPNPPESPKKERKLVKWKKPKPSNNIRKAKIDKQKNIVSRLTEDDEDFSVRGRKWAYKGKSSRDYRDLTGDKTNWELTEKIHNVLGLDFTSHSYYMTKNGSSSKFKLFKNNPTAKVKLEHFLNKANVALNRFELSHIVHAHINQEDQKIPIEDALIGLTSDFGIPAWIEYYEHSNSYRLIYKLDTILTKSRSLNKLEELMSCGNMIKTSLIYSHKYTPLPLGNLATKTGTFSYFNDKFIEEEVGIHNMFNIIEQAPTITVPLSVKIEEWKADTVPKAVKDTEVDTVRFRYGNGTRYQTQYKIAHYCVHKSLTVDDFINLCEECNDGTSKDMANWSENTKRSALSNTFSYASNHHNFTMDANNEVKTKNGLIYNPSYVSLKDHELLDLEVVLRYFYHKNKIGIVKDGKTENRIIKDSIEIFKFFLQRVDYEKRVRRRYIQEHFAFLNEGTMFSESMIKLFAKEKEIKNWKKCWKLIEQSGLVEAIYTDITTITGKKKRINHSYFMDFKWCKHYLTKTIKFIYQYISKAISYTKNNIYSLVSRPYLYNIDLFSYYIKDINFFYCINNKVKFSLLNSRLYELICDPGGG